MLIAKARKTTKDMGKGDLNRLDHFRPARLTYL